MNAFATGGAGGAEMTLFGRAPEFHRPLQELALLLVLVDIDHQLDPREPFLAIGLVIRHLGAAYSRATT
jgi:hypothetical protein